MSFNKIQNYKFNVSFTSDFIANNQMNSILFLKDKNGNIIKNNNNFIVFENASFLLKMFSENIEISGNILLEKSLKHLNGNLFVKNIFEIFNKVIFKKELNYISIEIKQLTVDTLVRKFKIQSLNGINVDDNNFYKSKKLIGQIIKTKSGLNLIQGKNGINVEIKEKNNLKYYTINYSAYSPDISNKSSYLTKINDSGIVQSNSDSFLDKNNVTQYALTLTTDSSDLKYFDGTLTGKTRKYTKCTINQNFEHWNVGKSVIYIDTKSTLTNSVDIYQMSIDLNNRKWQIGEEITFYLNLYKNSTSASPFESYMSLPFSESKQYPINIYPESTVGYDTQPSSGYFITSLIPNTSPTSLRKNTIYYFTPPVDSRTYSLPPYPGNIYKTFDQPTNILGGNSQLDNSFLNKYAVWNLSPRYNTIPYTYYMPVSPQINDFVGFYHYTGDGIFIVEYPAGSGKYLTGPSPISSSSQRKNFIFSWNGTTWVDTQKEVKTISLSSQDTVSNGDYIIIKMLPTTNTGSLDITLNQPNNNTTSTFKNYSFSNALKYILLKYINNVWTEIPDGSEKDNFINEKVGGVFYSHQYVINFPANHILFSDNNIASSNSSGYFSLKNKIIDTYNCQTNYDQIRLGQNPIVTPGNILPQNLKFFNNSICFDSSLDGASFTFRFLGFSDPSRPGVGLWQIK